MYTSRMKAAVLESLKTIRVKEIPEPACGAEEAILKVESCAVRNGERSRAVSGLPPFC